MTTIRTIAIETLAEKINGKLWIKGDMKRIYLDCGHNTKKMSTKTYIFQRQDSTFGISCIIECPSQNDNWIESQQTEIIESLEKEMDNILAEHGHDIEDHKVAIEAALAEEQQVQGFYMRWKEVRVAINSFGKLAYRKRQFVNTYKGAISRIPAGFVVLNDEEFALAVEKETKEVAYEYGNEPDFSALIARDKQRIIEQQEAQEQASQEAEQQRQKAIEINDAIMTSGGNILQAWKQAGSPHPAPVQVMEAKNASGLNWRMFTETIAL